MVAVDIPMAWLELNAPVTIHTGSQSIKGFVDKIWNYNDDEGGLRNPCSKSKCRDLLNAPNLEVNSLQSYYMFDHMYVNNPRKDDPNQK